MQIADVREDLLNRLLSQAWNDYAKAISTGETLELEAQYETSFVRQVLTDVIDVQVETGEAA